MAYSTIIRRQEADRFAVLVLYEGKCIPGMDMKFYATMRNAEIGAAKMLAKVK